MFHGFKCQIYSLVGSAKISLSSFFLLLLERNDSSPCRGHKRRGLALRGSFHCGGGYILLHCRGASKLRTTVRACREWFLLKILFRVGHLYSSFRNCCFSVLKEGNESSLFVFLTWVGSEELLICCCEE